MKFTSKWSKSVVAAGALFAVSALAVAPSASAATYTVQNGETLYAIAQKYGINLNKLIVSNPQLQDPSCIWAGLPIKLPTQTPAPTQPTKPSQPAPTQPSKPTTPTTPTTPVKPTPTPTTPTKPTPAPTTPGNGGSTGGTGSDSSVSATQKQYAAEVVNLVNQERSKAGLAPLTSNHAALNTMAMDKAKDMYNNNYFDHTSPTFGSPFDMMKKYGISFSYAGENIAKGQRNPQEVMNAWMNSSGHRANILSSNFTTIGVAYYNGVWVQEFIR